MYSWKLLRKLKWKIPGEPLAARWLRNTDIEDQRGTEGPTMYPNDSAEVKFGNGCRISWNVYRDHRMTLKLSEDQHHIYWRRFLRLICTLNLLSVKYMYYFKEKHLLFRQDQSINAAMRNNICLLQALYYTLNAIYEQNWKFAMLKQIVRIVTTVL